MSVGIDLSGRALRWQIEQEAVNTRHVLLGCPPYADAAGAKDHDERITWGSPKNFRPQVCNREFNIVQGNNAATVFTANLLSIEAIWRDLTQRKNVWQSASLVADALKAHLPTLRNEQGKLAFVIPNRLNEDAQDALLRALSGIHSDVSLLWRPVAAMLYWLTAGDGEEVFANTKGTGAVWVLDLDSAGLEFTRLTWRRHQRDNAWIAPVRTCATDIERRRNLNYTALNGAWSELFSNIPERDQLRCCQTAPEVQEQLESEARAFDIWVCAGIRWQKVHVTKPDALPHTWHGLQNVLTHQDFNLAQGDTILVYGWLTHLDADGLKAMLEGVWPGRNIRVLPLAAVAEGSRLFAERRAENQPTYYDTLPEYRIWTSQGGRQLVAPNQEVEPGIPWTLNDDAIHNAFCINRHRDRFSMLVRRLPCDDPDYDYARRLQVDLFTPLPQELPLRLDATVEAARGNARFTVTAADDSRPFVSDGKQGKNSVILTYALDPDDHAQGRETKPEPEHKGYLEAQPVIGRIYDDPANLEMLSLLVRYCNGEEDQIAALQNAVQQYRVDSPPVHCAPIFPFSALDRWGWRAHPSQPTRGLFGTRVLPDREISELAEILSNHLWQNGNIPAGMQLRNNWSKQNNYCHGHASQAYKNHIRSLLRINAPFPSYSEAHGPGFVLGDHPDDLQLLVNYCENAHFSDPQQAKMLCWSLFRMLCWHTGITINLELVQCYLNALINYLPNFNLNGFADVPRKDVLFSILFALSVRETHPDFLANKDDPLRERLLRLINFDGQLANVCFPPTMVANMNQVGGCFSDYVARFIRKTDTIEDRELGSAIGTMQ